MGLEVSVRPQKKNWKDEVNEQEKMFCDFILAGRSQTEAMFLAGYYPMEHYKDPAWRRKASSKAGDLRKKKAVVIYLNKNKTRVMISEPCDSLALERHIYDIAMGTVTQNVRTPDGEIVKIPPSFKDQISAASIYFKTEEARQKRVLTTEKEVGASSGVSLIAEETKVLLSRFNLREIVTTDFIEKHPEIEEEAEVLAEYEKSDN